MKRTFRYIIGGLAIVSLTFLLLQDQKKEDITKMDSVNEMEDKDVKDNRKKVGKIERSKSQAAGLNQIESSISKKETNNGISIIYEIHNRGDQDIRLQFPSSQEYDYEIYNEAGDVIYRYSNEHMFAQVIRNVLFAKGTTLTFVAGLPPLEKGEYRIVFWPSARGLDHLKEELTFTVDK